MKKLLLLISVALFTMNVWGQENSIDFNNTERDDHTETDGLLYYDLNLYPNYPEFTGGDGGGLSIYNSEDGWGALISTSNMQWLTPTFDGGIFNGVVKIDLNNLGLVRASSNTSGAGFGTENSPYVQIKGGTNDLGYSPVFWLRNEESNIDWGIFLDVNDDDKFKINKDGSDKLIITKLGKVGIGTTEPDYLLSVAGTIGCGEVIVEDVSEWADFVFEPEYELMSLKELDNFIQENKHLPEIPTTKEVEENGISVGEMNAKLLQKIEELTLYVIELKKENEEQKQTNKELVKRIENLENK